MPDQPVDVDAVAKASFLVPGHVQAVVLALRLDQVRVAPGLNRSMLIVVALVRMKVAVLSPDLQSQASPGSTLKSGHFITSCIN